MPISTGRETLYQRRFDYAPPALRAVSGVQDVYHLAAELEAAGNPALAAIARRVAELERCRSASEASSGR